MFGATAAEPSPRALGQQFWESMRRWGQFMMKEGVFAWDEMGFGHATDSPKGR